MSNLKEYVARNLLEALEKTEINLPGSINSMISEAPEEFGHYQTTIALSLAKQEKCAPMVIVNRLMDHLKQKVFDKIDVKGPGFINFTFSKAFLSEHLQQISLDPYFGIERVQKGHRVIVDYSSPNIAKPLHVGHLRSTIIGEAISRVLAFMGYDVLKLNHVGDFGTQFGMLIAFIKRYEPGFLSKKDCNGEELLRWYQEAKREFDSDPLFKEEAYAEVLKLQRGDEEVKKLWKRICAFSQEEVDKIYSLLDVHLETRGESYYAPLLPQVIEDMKPFSEISEGANCLFLDSFVGKDKEPLPLMIQKSDGGYNYATTDLAALKQRVQQEKAERIIYVTDIGQKLHFDMVFAAGKKAGYYAEEGVRLDHVGFGLVQGEDGKKFKTRSGTVEKLSDLLLRSIERAEEILQEKNGEVDKSTAKIIGIDAVKYADLSSVRTKNYVFSYDKMLRFEGNTAPFILYAYVRTQSILRLSGKPLDTIAGFTLDIEHLQEERLALHLLRFSSVLKTFSEDLYPHKLCDYLFVLAETFHQFFRDCRVVGSEQEESRLKLCHFVGKVLETGCTILGLKLVDKM